MLTLQLQIPATVTRVISMPSARLILLIPVDTTAAVSILTLGVVVVSLEIVDVSLPAVNYHFTMSALASHVVTVFVCLCVCHGQLHMRHKLITVP